MCLAEPGGAADLARARPGPYPARPGQPSPPSPPWRCAATTPPGTGRCGGSWRWARPAATSPTPRRRASCSLSSAAGSSRSRTVSQAAQRAREGLIAGGDLANAGYTYYPAVSVPAGLRALAGRLRRRGGGGAGLRAPVPAASRSASGSTATGGWLGVLRGESSAAAGEAAVDRPVRRQPAGASPRAYSASAVAAAIFGDPVGLTRHTAAAMPLLPLTARPLPDRRGPPAARAGARRAGPRRRTVTSAARCCPSWTR